MILKNSALPTLVLCSNTRSCLSPCDFHAKGKVRPAAAEIPASPPSSSLRKCFCPVRESTPQLSNLARQRSFNEVLPHPPQAAWEAVCVGEYLIEGVEGVIDLLLADYERR